MSKKWSVTLDANDARYLARGALPAISRDDITPILTGANFCIANKHLTVLSTDRYRMHAIYLDPIKAPSGTADFLVPRDGLVWLSKNAGAFFTRTMGVLKPLVEITFTEESSLPSDTGRVEFRVRSDESSQDAISYSGPLIRGNFPPIQKLLDKAREAEEGTANVRLNFDHLSSIKALDPGFVNGARIRFTKGDDRKPGPVHVVYATEKRTFAEAIIQPYLEES